MVRVVYVVFLISGSFVRLIHMFMNVHEGVLVQQRSKRKSPATYQS